MDGEGGGEERGGTHEVHYGRTVTERGGGGGGSEGSGGGISGTGISFLLPSRGAAGDASATAAARVRANRDADAANTAAAAAAGSFATDEASPGPYTPTPLRPYAPTPLRPCAPKSPSSETLINSKP